MKTDYRWELIDHIAVPVLILDQEGQIRAINADGRRFLGIGDPEISAGCSLSEFLPENNQEQFESHLQQVNAGLEVSDLEINLQILDRSPVTVLITGQHIDPEPDREISTIWTLKPQLGPGSVDQPNKLADFQWLAEQGRKLLSMNDWQEILYFSSTVLQEKVGDCIILTLTNIDEDHLLLEGVFGLEDSLLSKAFKLIGGDFQGRVIPINDHFRETYSKRSLYLHPGGLEEFAISQVPENISRRLSKLVGLDKIYTIGLETNHKVLGCYYIFTLDRDLKINQELVESFTFQVALALEKSLFSRELELSQQQFETIFEYAPDGYFVSDSQGNFLNGNREAERITGYKREEFIGKNFLKSSLLTANQLPRAAKLLAKGFAKKATEPSEFLLKRKDGSKITIEVSTHPVKLGGQSVVLGIARDVSHRRLAEDNLNLANETITRVLEGIDAHVYAADFDSYEILYMNKKMIEDYGGDFTGKLCFEVFRGVKEICQNCSNKHVVNEQGEPGEVHIWEGQNFRTKKWYRNYDRAIYWTGKQLARLQIAVDITDSKQATNDLVQSEERYRILFDKSHNALMTVAPPEWNFTSGNAAMVEMFRLRDEKHFLEMKPWMLSPEFQPDGRSSLEKAREMIGIAVNSGSNFFNWTHRRLDGEDFPATVQLTRVEMGEDLFLQATVRDITERIEAKKLLEQQMEDLALINQLVTAANRGEKLSSIFSLFSREVKRIFECNNTHVYVLESDQTLRVDFLSPDEDFRAQIEKVIRKKMPQHLSIPLDKNPAYCKLLDLKEISIVEDKKYIQSLMKEMLTAATSPGIISQGLGKLVPVLYQKSGIQLMVFVPMIISGNLVGLIDLAFPRQITTQDLGRIKTIAEQLNGIIQRGRIETDRAVKLQELEFINQAIGDVARLNDLDEICDNLAISVRKINPEAYVVVSLYDPALESIRVRSVKGLGKLGDRVIDMLGGKPDQIQINTKEYILESELNALYTSGKLELVPGGLYSLTRGKFSRQICKSIEKLGGVDRMYIAGFGLGEVSTGGLVLMLKEGAEIQHPEAIEAVVRHYAVVFERRIAQEEVLKRKVQLEALKVVEHEIASELDIDSLLQSIAEKATKIVNASACGFSIYNPEREVLEYTAYTGFDELPEVTDVYPGEGLSGMVWEQKETITVQNYAEWEGRLENWAPLSNYYLAGIPVSWGDEMLGVLEVALDPSESLSRTELDTLELFATQAAIALKNARLFRDEKNRRTEAETLREVGVIINQMVDQPDLLEMILVSLQKVVPYHSASIQLVKGPDVVVEAFNGVDPQEGVIGTNYKINENQVAKRILYEGQRVILNSRAEIESQLANPGSREIASWLAVPMESKGNRIGILTLDHINPGQYSEQDASLVADFSSQAVVALENSRLFEAIRRRTQEIEVVYDSALTLTKELQPEVLFEHLYELIQPIFNPDAYILATYETTADMIRIAYATEAGVRQPQAEGMLISPGERNSLLSWIVRKKTALCIGNVETDSLPFQPQQRGKTIHSWLGVPLLIGDRVCGALVVQSYQANKFTHDDQRLLQLLGNQVAVALENSRLYENSQRRLSRLASLHEIDLAISGSVDLRTTLDVLIGHLLHTLGVDAACVLFYNQTSQTLEYVNAKGFRTTSLQYTSLKIGTGLAGKAALEHSLVYIPDLTVEATSLQQSPQFAKEEFVTYLAQPLIAKGELVGVLEVFHRQKLTPDPEWFRFLDSLSGSAAIAIDRLNLFNDLERSHTELKQAYDATIEGWSRAIELRDGETSGHSRRVVALTMNLARKMGLSEEELTHMRRGSLLHDIGKMAVPDGILLKAGKLSDEEWLVMKKHPGFAYEMLSKINYLEQALEIPYAHHERWDGSGYPRGLAGEDIPLQARIFAVVDVWDALQSDRPYREAWPKEKAIQYLRDESGKEFDPAVVEEFLDLLGLE